MGAVVFVEVGGIFYQGDILGRRIVKLVIAPEQLFPIYEDALLFVQCRDVFVVEEKWKQCRGRGNKAGRVHSGSFEWQIDPDRLLRLNGRVYVLIASLLRLELL